MRRSVLNLALVFTILAMPALAEGGGGGGEGTGPSAILSPPPAAARQSAPAQSGASTATIPRRLPGIYGQHTRPIPPEGSSSASHYALGKTGLTLVVHGTRADGSPVDVTVAHPTTYARLSGKLVSFEPRRGGSYIIEIQYAGLSEPVRYFIGRTGNIETLTR